MIEGITALLGLIITAVTRDPDWAIAAGLFAVAGNLNLIYHKGE